MSKRHLDYKKQPVVQGDMVSKGQLPRWVVSALRNRRITHLSKIAQMTDEELLQIPGVGRRAVDLIRAEMARVSTIEPADLDREGNVGRSDLFGNNG